MTELMTQVQPSQPKTESRWIQFWQQYRSSPLAVMALLVLVLTILLALLALHWIFLIRSCRPEAPAVTGQ